MPDDTTVPLAPPAVRAARLLAAGVRSAVAEARANLARSENRKVMKDLELLFTDATALADKARVIGDTLDAELRAVRVSVVRAKPKPKPDDDTNPEGLPWAM